MQYFMINTHEGEPVAVVGKGSLDHGEIEWVEDCHVVNEIHGITIRGKHIIFTGAKGEEFASITCEDPWEAKCVAMARYGHVVAFTLEALGEDD